MRFILVHLSDIHLRAGSKNVITERTDQIARAICSLARDVDVCILCITGDVAYSGSENEYLIAASLFQEIRTKISEYQEGIETHVVCCPGNHDCDFSGEQSLRDLVQKAIATGKTPLSQAFVEQATSIQASYFRFLEDVETLERNACAPTSDVQIAYQYTLKKSSKEIRIVCLNTAWMSQINERPGTMIFPAESVPDKNHTEDLSIVLYHHPTNWFEPNNRRQVRNRIETFADLVLTGHEHVSTRTETSGERGSRFTQIEGGVLQESGDADESIFNVLVVDVVRKGMKFFRCSWTGDSIYECKRVLIGGDETDEWEDLPLNRARRLTSISLSQKMEAHIADPGLALTHPRSNTLRLEDIYVYPDLRVVDLKGDAMTDSVLIIRGAKF